MGPILRRIGQVAGGMALLLGIFWAGRVSTHGLAAFWEHWWCPVPLALTVIGAAVVITARRASPST